MLTGMRKKSDIHMEVLKFARDNPGFTLEEFQLAFSKDFDWLRREIQHSKVFQSDGDLTGSSRRFFLSFDDRFKLLEHEELRAAQRSSRWAFLLATFSIVIAIGGIFYQQYSVSKVEVINFPVSVEEKANDKPLNTGANKAGDDN